jgi:hypothetical protein
MAGTEKDMYRVEMFFFVYADDDDDARNKVTSTLAHDTRYAWAWRSTQLENKGETSDTND